MMHFEEYDDESQSGWTVCTRCEIEHAEPDYDICLGCFYDLEEEREAINEGDDYDDGWRICSRCNTKWTEPGHSICLDCTYASEVAEEVRCEICPKEQLPHSFLCQDCTDYLWNWEKEQWKDIFRDLKSLLAPLRYMLHWTLIQRTKEKLRRLLRR